MDKDDIADQLDDMAEKFYDEQATRMGQQLFEHAQRNGLTIELIAGATHPLQRAIAQVARGRLGDEYGQLASARLTGLSPELDGSIKQIFAEGVALGRDRFAILQVVDKLWIRHLTVLDDIREEAGHRIEHEPTLLIRRRADDYHPRNLLRAKQDAICAGGRASLIVWSM